MKVKDLKKQLNKLPDDMDVKILLPEVEDWADVKIEKISLKKMKKEEKLGLINWQNKQYDLGRPETKIEDVKESEWEIHGEYLDDKVKTMYDFKEALLLKPKSRGKSTFDRFGKIQY